METIRLTYGNYMAMWTRLDELIVPVCREIAHALHLDTAAVLDASARFYGFSNHGSLQAGLGAAARTKYLLEEFIVLELEEKLALDDAAFLRAMAFGHEQCEDIGKALEMVINSQVRPASSNAEIPTHYPLSSALDEFRKNLLLNFTASKEFSFSPESFGHAVKFSAFLATTGFEGAVYSQVECLRAICNARHQFLSPDTKPEHLQELIATVNHPEWARNCSPALPKLKAVLQELNSGGPIRQLSRRYPDAVELRSALRLQPTEYFDNVDPNDFGPTVYLTLVHAPENARFDVFVDSSNIDNPEFYSSILFDIVYISSLDDLLPLLFCSPYKPASIDTITLAEARKIGAPDLAGWYKVSWSWG
ncbi:hypothetical protein [Burkholderia ubonensis]|uniref:hypothetical protein n=1 Tax=Burkholderia ubonensis TaxID=101571 RepID=UPI0012F88C1F|nr:hypothetical protein [Burkholderia ubonensis]